MSLEEVIKKRKSIRSFKNIDVSDEILNQVISLAHLAPSAGAIRGYDVIITREKIIRIDAPVYLVICTDPEKYIKRYGERGRDLYSIQDATIVGAYIQLLLVNIKLASVWIGAFHENKIKSIIDTKLRPVAIIALGHRL